MSNYSSEWNTRVEYQGVHGGVSDGNKVMGHVGMCEDTTSERELRKTGLCRYFVGTMSGVRRDYVGIASGLCRGYVGAMSGFGLPYVGSESKPRRRDMPQKGPPRPSLAN